MSGRGRRRRKREEKKLQRIIDNGGQQFGRFQPVKRELRCLEFIECRPGNPTVWRLRLVSIARAAAENADGGGDELRFLRSLGKIRGKSGE